MNFIFFSTRFFQFLHRILKFFCEFFIKKFSGFRTKFQKRVTFVAFQSILRKQIRKLPNILKSVKIIQYYFSQSSFQIDPNSNEYLRAKFGFNTVLYSREPLRNLQFLKIVRFTSQPASQPAENEPCKVCPLSAYRSPRFPSCNFR